MALKVVECTMAIGKGEVSRKKLMLCIQLLSCI
jgi:hypothetical protein